MIERDKLYPLVFKPIYHGKMWGGSQIKDFLKRKDLPKSKDPIGESWELVDREDEQSVVVNGPLKGMTISQLVTNYGQSLLGGKYTGGRFPLLVKIIDASERLSLQVHPDEQTCAKLGKGAEPKTEMWYILNAQKGAKIMAGVNPRSTKHKLLSSIKTPDVEKELQVFESTAGDAYFISSGTLHAIGEGNLLIEVQQNSDTTYRVSDWGRVDEKGNSRELHVDQALESINYTNRTSPRIPGVVGIVQHNRKFAVVNRCRFFTVDDLRLIGEWNENTTTADSFHLISCINKAIRISTDESTIDLTPGQTCLIPANLGFYRILPMEPGETNVLKTTL